MRCNYHFAKGDHLRSRRSLCCLWDIQNMSVNKVYGSIVTKNKFGSLRSVFLGCGIVSGWLHTCPFMSGLSCFKYVCSQFCPNSGSWSCDHIKILLPYDARVHPVYHKVFNSRGENKLCVGWFFSLYLLPAL